MSNLTNIEEYALAITSGLISGYGREILGDPNNAIPSAVSLFFKVGEEVKRQSEAHAKQGPSVFSV
jgi:hypothetical protein